VALAALAGLHGLVEAFDLPRPRAAERVERAGLDEALHHPAVDEPEIDPGAKVAEGSEAPRLAPGLDDGLNGRAADVLDGRKAEGDHLAHHGEARPGDIDVGGLDAQPHAPALLYVLDDLVRLLHLGREQCGHELDGMVGLEERGLVGDEPVAGRVRLVESAAGDLLDEVPDPFGLAPVDLVGAAAHGELPLPRGPEVA